jgi:hypothetical protein
VYMIDSVLRGLSIACSGTLGKSTAACRRREDLPIAIHVQHGLAHDQTSLLSGSIRRQLGQGGWLRCDSAPARA